MASFATSTRTAMVWSPSMRHCFQPVSPPVKNRSKKALGWWEPCPKVHWRHLKIREVGAVEVGVVEVGAAEVVAGVAAVGVVALPQGQTQK